MLSHSNGEIVDMRCLTSLLVALLACGTVVYSQSPVRCFDCNSGGTGFGSEICPPNGDLKQELLTTVRCSERCFSRTMVEKPGVVQRGCSAGIGFFLSRPLPKDGCVQVENSNWWCFCSDSFCNVDDMTKFGEETDGMLPLNEEPVVSKVETLEPWTQPRTEPTTRRTTTTTTTTTTPATTTTPVLITTPGPEPETMPTTPFQQPGEAREGPQRGNAATDEQEVEPVEPPSEENLEEPSYEEPLETWEEQPYLEPEEKRPGREDSTEAPSDRHYTRHSHGHHDVEEPSAQQPLALP